MDAFQTFKCEILEVMAICFVAGSIFGSSITLLINKYYGRP